MAAVPVMALAHASAPPATPRAALTARPIAVVAGDEAALGHRPVDRASRSDTVETTTTVPPTTLPPTTTTGARQPYKPTLYAAAPRTAPQPTVRRTPPTTRPVSAARPAAGTPTTRPASPSSAAKPTASAAPTGNSQTGGASWYDAAPPGTCAHRTLPKGTVVHITDVANGATATCTVEDRGPYVDGLVIDLAKDVFSQMAPLSTGVIQVRITW